MVCAFYRSASMCCSLSTESNHFGCPLGGLVEGRVRVLKRINFLGFKRHRWLEWRRQKTTNFSEGRVLRNTPLPNKNLTSTTQKTPVAVYHKHTGNIDPIQQSWQRYNKLSVQLVWGVEKRFIQEAKRICVSNNILTSLWKEGVKSNTSKTFVSVRLWAGEQRKTLHLTQHQW